MGLFDFLKKKKEKDEVPPSTWLPTPPPVREYDRDKPIEASNAIKKFQKANDLGSMAKILAENGVISVPKDKHHNTRGASLDHLTPEKELPFGWISHNREFTDKIQSEHSYFLNNWVNSHRKDVLQEYSALKSFIQYMKDVQKLCDSKGECFSFWCSEYLIGTGYVEKRQDDLKYLEEHMNEIIHNETVKQNVLPNLRKDLIQIITATPGIKQTDIYKVFDPNAKELISSELYYMEKDGLIKREKSSRTYALTMHD